MNSTLKAIASILLLVTSMRSAGLGQTLDHRVPPVSSFRDSVIVGKDTISVFISKVPFRRSAHKIDSSKTKFGLLIGGRGDVGDTMFTVGRIDGREFYGTDGGLPRYEIDRFEVSWNKRIVKIPKSLYSDCFDPSFLQGDHVSIQIVASENGSQVLIQMHGSDGAGAYTVWWIIARSGKHSRHICRQC